MPLIRLGGQIIALPHTPPPDSPQIVPVLLGELRHRPRAPVRIQILRRRHGRPFLVEKPPQAVVVARLEFLARRWVPHRFRQSVFGHGEGDARARAPHDGHAAGFVLFAVAEADLPGGGGGEGVVVVVRGLGCGVGGGEIEEGLKGWREEDGWHVS